MINYEVLIHQEQKLRRYSQTPSIDDGKRQLIRQMLQKAVLPGMSRQVMIADYDSDGQAGFESAIETWTIDTDDQLLLLEEHVHKAGYAPGRGHYETTSTRTLLLGDQMSHPLYSPRAYASSDIEDFSIAPSWDLINTLGKVVRKTAVDDLAEEGRALMEDIGFQTVENNRWGVTRSSQLITGDYEWRIDEALPNEEGRGGSMSVGPVKEVRRSDHSLHTIIMGPTIDTSAGYEHRRGVSADYGSDVLQDFKDQLRLMRAIVDRLE